MGANSALVALAAVAAAAGIYPLGFRSDRSDRRFVVANATLASAIAGLVLSMSEGASPLMIFVGVGMFSAVSILLYTLVVAHANDHADAGNKVEIAGGLLLVWTVGTVIGPLLASVSMTAFGPGGLFVLTAVTHVALGAYAAWRTTRRAGVPEEDRGDFAEAAAIAQVVVPIEGLDEA